MEDKTNRSTSGARSTKYVDRRIRNLIRNCIDDDKQRQKTPFYLHLITADDKSEFAKFSWLFLLISATLLFLQQLRERILYFSADQIRTTTTYVPLGEDSNIEAGLILSSLYSHKLSKVLNNCLNLVEVSHYCFQQPAYADQLAKTVTELLQLNDVTEDIQLKFKNPEFKKSVQIVKQAGIIGKELYLIFTNLQSDFFRGFEIHFVPPPECSQFVTELFFRLAIVHGHSAIMEKPFLFTHNQHIEIQIHELLKFERINRKGHPCLTADQVKECKQRAEENFRWTYRSQRCNCRMPYDEVSNMTICSISESFGCTMADVDIYNTNSVEEIYSRRCSRPCKESSVITTVHVVNSNDTRIWFTNVQLHVGVVSVEIQFYFVTDLLCEIGGLAAFYFGLSILTVIEILSIRTQQTYNWYRSNNRNQIESMCKTVKYIVTTECYDRDLEEGQRCRLLAILKQHGIRFFLGLLCGFLVCERISHYTKTPIMQHYKVRYSSKEMMLPLYYCHESEAIQHFKQMYKHLKSVDPIEDVPLWKMVGMEINDSWKLTAAQIWDAANTVDSTLMVKDFYHGVLMQLGACQWSYSQDYVNMIDFMYRKQPHDFHITIGVVPSEDDNTDIIECQPSGHAVKLDTYIVKYSKINRMNYPCFDKSIVVQCKNDCRQKASTNVRCSLPYMGKDVADECETPTDASKSRSLYQQMFDECLGNCPNACVQTVPQIYENIRPYPYVNLPNGLSGFSLMYQGPHIRKISVTQLPMYTKYMLLSDIGNLIHITLKLCIISIARLLF